MKLNINFNPFKKKEARQEERSYNFLSDSLFYNSATTYSESKAMLLSAVYINKSTRTICEHKA